MDSMAKAFVSNTKNAPMDYGQIYRLYLPKNEPFPDRKRLFDNPQSHIIAFAMSCQKISAKANHAAPERPAVL